VNTLRMCFTYVYKINLSFLGKLLTFFSFFIFESSCVCLKSMEFY